jgi:hypothetical protein
MLNVEYPYIVCGGDYCSIVGIWHEFDREDVALVACQDRGREAKLGCRRFGLIRMDVDSVIIGA